MEGDMPRGHLHLLPPPAELYSGEKAKINPQTTCSGKRLCPRSKLKEN